mmetsp:Transcript_15093/g.19579  ORF Transcript_15093/g.19579 Transcript_15093/m.19579 type:complete len:390 (-) Transcript_15093:305-1474(-)|eukprot:CAMPEP_0114345774 /NCGR_PEP_ID=MMETSP0101-20121206/12528_1 /TAXON_ID=38822 ORGANISM="Pteridomonas danica, Strain PT" /NCGR_SAMPLE_ID=MMETSP0101 /ASSEMBLY_ACC=CAM_ASM_000211 /LENGTH=389 /DNA_ID=CAMNT_0001482003 /DNA_START=200 /DNA_END=1369 /DNA_ORIENTATION=-
MEKSTSNGSKTNKQKQQNQTSNNRTINETSELNGDKIVPIEKDVNGESLQNIDNNQEVLITEIETALPVQKDPMNRVPSPLQIPFSHYVPPPPQYPYECYYPLPPVLPPGSGGGRYPIQSSNGNGGDIYQLNYPYGYGYPVIPTPSSYPIYQGDQTSSYRSMIDQNEYNNNEGNNERNNEGNNENENEVLPIQSLYHPGPPIQMVPDGHGPEGCNLFIFHIPNEMSNLDLFNFFSPYGNVISARIMVDNDSGRSRGFGFVSFDHPASANNAIIHMNGLQIGKKRLKVQHKKDKDNMDSPGYGPSSDEVSKSSSSTGSNASGGTGGATSSKGKHLKQRKSAQSQHQSQNQSQSQKQTLKSWVKRDDVMNMKEMSNAIEEASTEIETIPKK